MKENIGFFSQPLDHPLAIDNACRGLQGQLAKKGQGLALLIKKHLYSGLAACGIGAMWYAAILLFLRQLAEYGW